MTSLVMCTCTSKCECGTNNICIGKNTGKFITTGNYNMIFGKNSDILNKSGSYNMIIGETSHVTGTHNIVMGSNNNVDGHNNIAIGHNIHITGNNQVIIQAHNEEDKEQLMAYLTKIFNANFDPTQHPSEAPE
jgi:hypothetical protein